MRGGNRVGVFASLEDGQCLEARFPLGMQRIRDEGLHPAGETFVQPQVIPPGHGDEVAEPLVRHFVGDDFEHFLTVRFGGGLRIEQEMVLRIEDRAPVLHGAALDLTGSGDQVELRQRKSDAEIFVVVMQNLACLIERVARLRGIAALHHDTHVDAVHRGVNAFKVPDPDEQQIRRHLGGRRETYPLHRG